MLRRAFHEPTVSTRWRGFCEFTREVEKWLEQNRFTGGLLTPHFIGE